MCLVPSDSIPCVCGVFALACVLIRELRKRRVYLGACIGACFLIHARTQSVMGSVSISVKLFGDKVLFVLV